MAKKLGSTGKTGQLSTGKKSTPTGTIPLQKIDVKSIGSAMGILKKHHN